MRAYPKTLSAASILSAKNFRIIALLCVSLLALGCAKSPAPKDETATLVDQSLSEAARQISADLALIAGSVQAREKGSGTGALADPLDMTFDGPITQALEAICARTGFRLAVVGKPRQVPVLVHIRAKNRPALEILRDIGLQTGPYERLRVIEQIRLIELSWIAPETKPSGTKGQRP